VIIARYLTREVFTTLLGITLVLLLAFLSQQFVRYLSYVAVGKIPTNVLLMLVSFEIPYLLAMLLPLGLYLGILLAYGRLYADNEMAILQLYGYGNRAIIRLTLFLALIIAMIVLYLMIAVNPWVSAKRQKVMASDAATLHLVQTLIPGRFQVSPDGRHVMYVEKLSLDRLRAENVFLAQEKIDPADKSKTGLLDKDIEKENIVPKQWMLVLAKQGYQTKDHATGESYFVTTDGFRYEGIPGQNDYKIVQFKKYGVRVPVADPRITRVESETLSMRQLWQDYHIPKRAGEFQWRFSLAIASLLLGLLAVPLSAVRPRQSRYLSLLPAVLIYIVYFNLLFISRRWMEQGTIPITVGMWWVHGAMCLLILALLISSNRSGSSS
jgi:lipopolysaccharide export system permease protein